MVAFDVPALPAFEPLGASERRPGWPGSTLEYSLPLRATAGLTQAYAAVDRSRSSAGSTSRAAREHATHPDGSLCLAPDMPLLARRYRFLPTLSETPVSQLLCAVDTYCSCSPRADGRRQPMVAIKVLNAQHWVLGAQEYERMRLLLVAQDQDGSAAPVASASSFFECGAHFCIVMPLLCELSRDVGSAGALLPYTHPAFSPRISSVQAHYNTCGSGLLEPRAADQPCKLNIETLRRLTARLLGALVFLHQHDVIHADIKPQNVMADFAGSEKQPGGVEGVLEGTGWRARLIDFSNAMSTKEATAYHDTFEVQTLGYRAPEVQGRECASRAPVISLVPIFPFKPSSHPPFRRRTCLVST
jgi:serine/threonine protein kinase